MTPRVGVRWLPVLFLALAASAADPPSEADRFAVSGLEEAGVRSFFDALQVAVRAGRNDQLAELIDYPLAVRTGSGELRIQDRAQFLSDPDAVFTRSVREQVLAQRFEDLFANGQGVMVGRGVLWFGGVCAPSSPSGACADLRIRITAIDQGAPR